MIWYNSADKYQRFGEIGSQNLNYRRLPLPYSIRVCWFLLNVGNSLSHCTNHMSEDCKLDTHEFTLYHNTFRPPVVVIKLHLLPNQGILPIIMLVAIPIKMKVVTHSCVALCSELGNCVYAVTENT